MRRLPEGIRRVSILLGVACVIALWVYVWNETSGFWRMETAGYVWLVVLSVPIFYVPAVFARLGLWVRDGFTIDRNR